MEEIQSQYNCIIVDDEQNAIDVLVHHLKDYSKINILRCFTNAIEANAFCKSTSPDLIFLDIQMPGISGIDFLRSLRNPPTTFLTTAYRHYAPEAFELNVLDYLLKPISAQRFKKAVEKFEEHQRMIELAGESIENHIIVRANRSNIKLKFSDILYLESKGDYIKIHLKKKSILTKETLKHICKRLPSSFIQIHRSYIINSQYIDVETSTSIIINEEVIPVSRNFRS